MRQSGFLKRVESEQEKLMKEAQTLLFDESNYAIFCWKNLDGYDEIRKNALAQRNKAKGLKDKKDQYQIKQLRPKYAKE